MRYAIIGNRAIPPWLRHRMTACAASAVDTLTDTAFGLAIQLRQETASIDLPVLKHLGDDIQPIIGIRFDAPFFTF